MIRKLSETETQVSKHSKFFTFPLFTKKEDLYQYPKTEFWKWTQFL